MKALFAVSAAQELEADLLLRGAERGAELLRKADHYDAEGLHGIANHLRQQAEVVNVQRPLAGVLPAVEHLAGNQQEDQSLRLLSAPSSNGQSDSRLKVLPISRKKGGKS